MLAKIIAKIIIVTLLALGTLWAVGLYDFYNRIPVQPVTNDEKTDAIIVLTGGQDRIAEGVRLLNHNYAPKMLVSGVSKSTKFEQMVESQKLPADEARNIDYSKIQLGRKAVNTVGNALETSDWVIDNKIKSIRLVTAGYHMPRALVEFRKQMPGLKIIPHPVFPATFSRDNWRDDELTRRFILSEYTKYIMARLGR